MQGVLWAMLATGLFATVAAMAKIAVAEYHVLQILFFRQIMVFLSSLPSLARSFPESLRTQHPGLHALRLIGAFVALSTGIWAVSVLPLTTAITLAFVQVFFVALLAARFLKEPVGISRICAILVGFLGVLVILRPNAQGFADPNAMIPVAGALGAALAVTSARRLSQTDSTATLLVYQSIFVGLLAGVPVFWLWKPPDMAGFLLLVTMGALATTGQWVGVKALRLAEASVIGNIQYTQLIYTAILGYVLFDEIPDVYTIFGALFIVSSALFILHRDRKNKRSE
ncbi:DMT family transporter [Shimia gijangensis]|nr:DMT family transporter [Shimia gijangensis]